MQFLKRLLILTISLIAAHSIFSQNRVVVNYTSDVTSMIKIGDTSVMKLVSNVYFYHNGAIISCDTAYYYYETNKFIGIGNVIINQDSLYIYGDRINYNRDENYAKVYSDLIKVVDSSTVMYTRSLSFNTESRIATYSGGATISQNKNLLESINGFYDTRTKLVMLRDRVSIKNEDYTIKTDSMNFNVEDEKVIFNTTTYIWKANGDFLKSDLGSYTKPSNVYEFYKNSYVMTPEQELWSDTLSYYSHINQVILRNNIQITDTVKRVISFGNYGQYWTVSKNALMTYNPSVLMYETDKPDTTFLKSDTLFMRPYFQLSNMPDTINQTDSLRVAIKEQGDMIAIDSSMVSKFTTEHPENAIPIKAPEIATLIDTLQNLSKDSLPSILEPLPQLKDSAVLTVDSVKLTAKEIKKKEREKRKLARKERFLQWLRDGGMEVEIDTVKISEKDTTIKIDTTTSTDTLSLLNIKNVPDSTDYIIRGFGNSKVFRKDVQMICDSIIAESVDSTITNIGTPILWNSTSQITSGRMRTYIKNGDVYRSRLFTAPILAQEVIDSGMYNQIKGNSMDAMYRDQTIYRIYVNEASQALYYKQGTDKGRPKIDGLVAASSVNMIVDIDNDEITFIKLFQDIETVTYPIRKIPATQTRTLDGFEWKVEFRPTQKDVFDYSIRKSIREEMNKIEMPTFYITEAINNQKELLLKEGKWRDRIDEIPFYKKTFTIEE